MFTLSCVIMLAVTGIYAPWGFLLGGKFHIIPYWQGWGELHAKSGKYVVFVRFEPSPRGSRMFAASNLTGIAYLCSPRHERFRMHLGGGMRVNPNLTKDGEAIRIYMHNWPPLLALFTGDHRPSIEFRGHWKNPGIVMDDHGSISNAFDTDGSVYREHSSSRPHSTEVVPVTLNPGSYSAFEAACGQ